MDLSAKICYKTYIEIRFQRNKIVFKLQSTQMHSLENTLLICISQHQKKCFFLITKQKRETFIPASTEIQRDEKQVKLRNYTYTLQQQDVSCVRLYSTYHRSASAPGTFCVPCCTTSYAKLSASFWMQSLTMRKPRDSQDLYCGPPSSRIARI